MWLVLSGSLDFGYNLFCALLFPNLQILVQPALCTWSPPQRARWWMYTGCIPGQYQGLPTLALTWWHCKAEAKCFQYWWKTEHSTHARRSSHLQQSRKGQNNADTWSRVLPAPLPRSVAAPALSFTYICSRPPINKYGFGFFTQPNATGEDLWNWKLAFFSPPVDLPPQKCRPPSPDKDSQLQLFIAND